MYNDVSRYNNSGGGGYNNYNQGGDRYQRQGSAPPYSGGSRWDNLDDDRGQQQGMYRAQSRDNNWSTNNRWDNRTDYSSGGYSQEATKENWSVPLPPIARLEE